MTSLATAGGATSANPGAIYYAPRQFKDFELSVDYRTAATNNNGGVFLRFPAPATVADIDPAATRSRSSTTARATTRTGAITQERGPATTFAAPTAPSTLYKPTREWNTLTIRAVRSPHPGLDQRRPDEHLRRRHPQRPRRLHRPRERGQQPDVPQRAHQGARARHGRADGHGRRARRRSPLGTARPAELQLRRRVRARELRRHARRPAGRQRRAAATRSPARTRWS